MARRKAIRLCSEIMNELYACINENLKEILNINKQLTDVTLPRERGLALTAKMFDIWDSLTPVHPTIRAQNPAGETFFNTLDHELAIYKKSAVNGPIKPVEEEAKNDTEVLDGDVINKEQE